MFIFIVQKIIMAFIKIQNCNLTEKEQKTIKEKLWAIEQKNKTHCCPDCAVKPNQKHKPNCDVPHCNSCNVQALQCKCNNQVILPWDGLWPNTELCYKNNLICWDTASSQWMFDLNEAARYKFKMFKNN